jgi:hypothetical protein
MPSQMDYTIFITKIRRAEQSTIVVRLAEIENDYLSRIITDELTYAVICYRDYTSHNLHLYEGNAEMVSQKLFSQFKANFTTVTENLLAKASFEIMQEMLETVELFIREYVAKHRDALRFI